MKEEKKSSCKDFFDAIILAGGESRRFGTDKCSFEIDGKTMLQRVAENFERPIIVTRIPRNCGIEIIDEGIGPIRALEIAVKRIEKDKVFVTGCDFPFLKRRVVEYICSKDYEIAMPLLEYPQPLLGCYNTRFLKNNISKVNSLQELIGIANSAYLIGTEEIKMIDLSLDSLRNINRLTDFYTKVKIFTKSKILLR
ncbi:NTP transferase domain-containing protein [Acidianus infernus]|uniref:NTP transferase domain-containing protein n=1 Tax=Acidianus infernus TaxID=12915 RepID=A0A6A9QG17_ACIIN|nr:molybdenum cofactor guanylyltransferase [Acidianus infernus]MCY0873626.1 molybdenum cofactor guanylyltransferase [Acidianus infernus]MUM64723.1 NTP transferase domain-containing protein [Acidianus infernus]